MKNIIYSKFSNDRAPSFKIRTDIYQDDAGNKSVIKKAMTKEAEEHIANIYHVYEKLTEKYGSKVGINRCSLENGVVELQYLQGKTLDEYLNQLYVEKRDDELLRLIDKYIEMISYKADEKPFEITEDFICVFGEVSLPEGLKCTSVADIDLIFENIIINQDFWNIIDYEWTFLFAVPLNFIIYRGISAFTEGLYGASSKKIKGMNLYEYCGIKEEEISVYQEMIANFEKYVMQDGCTMKNIHGMLSQKIHNPQTAINYLDKKLEKLGIQVFYDLGKGYEEKSSYFVAPNQNKPNQLELTVKLLNDCTGVRIDPAVDSCILHVKSICADGCPWDDYLSNGLILGKETVIFAHNDPQIYINGLQGKKEVTISADIELLDISDAKNVMHKIEQDNQEIAARNQIISDQDAAIKANEKIIKDLWAGIDDLNGAIEAIQNSPSWKLTAPLRKAKSLAKRMVSLIKNDSSVNAEGISAQMEPDVSSEKENEASDIMHQEENKSPGDLYIEYVLDIPETGKTGKDYVERTDKPQIKLEKEDVKYLAFYLPQYHAFPENDAWWGKNFTEWTNVTKTVPLFSEHYQPRLAGDLGYYDLSHAEAIKEQMELAKLYGVYGFCIYYYWFNGKKLMNKPLDTILENKDLDLPFCLCWANENWSRRWDGKSEDILIAQNYDKDFPEKFIADISIYISDARYIRIGGRPLLLVYNANEIPDLKAVLESWRQYCREKNIGELHIAAVDFALNESSKNAGFDSFVEFPPHSVYFYDKEKLNDKLNMASTRFQGDVYDYEEIVKKKEYIKGAEENVFPGVFLAWDNTARKKNAATIYHNYSPRLFGEWLSDVSAYEMAVRPKDERFVFINAWNEWAEGTYLEPDRRYGYAALDVVKKTLLDLRERKKIIYVSHDACFNGAQMLSLNIVKVLQEVFHYDVYVILKETGVLRQDFCDAAYEVICLEDGPWSDEQLKKWIFATGADSAICNTTVAGNLSQILRESGLRVISLIHEMEKVIKENKVENNLKIICENAEKIVFASDYVKHSCDNIHKLPEDKVVILPQGMYFLNCYLEKRQEIKKQIYQQYGIDEQQILVIGVGFGDYRKGVDLFIKSAIDCVKSDDKVTFMWVGDLTPEMSKVRTSLLEGTPYETKILFAGKQTDPMLYYTAADVFLLTSREDPFPTVVMEAMYSYLPVIAFRGGGGYVELIREDTGRLVEMENYKAMAKCVLEYANNQELLIKTGENVHKFVAERFRFAVYVSDLLGLLDKDVPSVSVVVPNYNYAHYLEGRLDSILQQDYPIKEILVLDDCSTDDSKKIIESYVNKYPDLIRSYMNENNSGNVFKQWDKGFQHATGDYVWVAEADDLSDSMFLRRIMGKLNSDENMLLCYSQSKMMDETGTVTGDNYFCYTDDVDPNAWKQDYIHDADMELRQYMTVKNTIPNVSGVVFKNGDYTEILKDAMQYSVAGDWRVYVDVLLRGGTIGFVADSLNYHRRHSNSVTTDLKVEKHYGEIVEMQDYIAEKLQLEKGEKVLEYREYLKEYFHLD